MVNKTNDTVSYNNNDAIKVKSAKAATVTVPENAVPQVLESLAKVARKKKQFVAPDESLIEYHVRSVEGIDGVERFYRYAEIPIELPDVSMPGWDLLGVIKNLGGSQGTVVYPLPGKDLAGWKRPNVQFCDHCETNRKRKNTFIVKEESTGQTRQVGSTCLENYTGIALTDAFAVLEVHDNIMDTYDEAQGVLDADPLISLDFILRLGYVLSDGGQNFVSLSEARESGKISIAEKVRSFVEAPKAPGGREAKAEILEEVKKVPADIVREIIHVGTSLLDDPEENESSAGNNSYAESLSEALSAEQVDDRHINIALSSIPIWVRSKVKKPEPYAAGYVAEVGEKVEGLKVTVERVSTLEGKYSPVTVLSMRDEDDHLLVWFATRVGYVEKGESFILSGRVKKHTTYNGSDQTVMTRCKLEESEDNDLGSGFGASSNSK